MGEGGCILALVRQTCATGKGLISEAEKPDASLTLYATQGTACNHSVSLSRPVDTEDNVSYNLCTFPCYTFRSIRTSTAHRGQPGVGCEDDQHLLDDPPQALGASDGHSTAGNCTAHPA